MALLKTRHIYRCECETQMVHIKIYGSFLSRAAQRGCVLGDGQLISKCLFGVFTFFQKMKENESTSSKVEFFVRFLEETSA